MKNQSPVYPNYVFNFTSQEIIDRFVAAENKRQSLQFNTESESKPLLITNEGQVLNILLGLFNTNRNVNFVLRSIIEKTGILCNTPDDICARILYNAKEYISPGFIQTPFGLKSSFETFSGKTGSLEFYLKKQLPKKDLFFSLRKARKLMDTITGILKNWLDKRETEKEVENMLVELEMKIESRTEELRVANQQLTEINKKIGDSINYANLIQRAILPDEKNLRGIFSQAFALYKPKDTVSGDFYWCHNSDGKVYFVCADCTGHGVPGALMSMVGNQLLDYIIIEKKITDPGMILKELDRSVCNLFRKSNGPYTLKDGMAISLCVIDRQTNTLLFAGGSNDAYLIGKDGLTVLKADRHSVGGDETCDGGRSFNVTQINYQSGDQLYMFTDGLPDQFGGERGKKLMKKNLLEMIVQNRHLTMDIQGQVFEQFLENWKGQNFQVDDVTLLGAKL